MHSKNWKFKIIVIISLCSTFLLNGCSLLPDSFLVSSPKQKYQNIADASPDLLSTEERLNSLEDAANEWQQSKPAINRLTELESDLSFIIEQIDRIETGSTIENLNAHVTRQNQKDYNAPELANLAIIDSTSVSTNLSFSSDRNLKQLAQPTSDTIQHVERDKFSSPNRSTNLTLGGVKPKNASQIEGSSTVDVQAAVSLAKFKGLSEISSAQAQTTCTMSDMKIGSGYAIHLASFKNKVTALETLKRFYNENSQLVCGKTPVIKDVVVKNQSFYSLRLGPYLDKKDAETSCRQVRRKQSYCGITKFDGGEIKI
ncbi:MAG: cell division septation protein DedD [Psychromonas sp.]|jgi:cell division septation protein DedD